MKSPIALALALSCATASAGEGTQIPTVVAKVSTVNGQVLLSQRARIGPALEGALLSAGDRLMTLDDSAVLVAFADGCEQRLGSDSLLRLGETSGCTNADKSALSFHQAIGESGGSAEEQKKGAVVVNAGNATGAESSTLTTGQKWAVAGALLIPALYYWDHNRDDNDRPPVSR